MTGVPVELINHYRAVMRWRNRIVGAAAAMLALGIVCFVIVINHQTSLGRQILRQSEKNGNLLEVRNAELRRQVDQARDLLTQLYAALNASQKQVISLGGVPEHFEFSVPTTTTTAPAIGSQGSVTTTGNPPSPTATGSAAGKVTVGLDSTLVLGVVFTPLLVPLLIPTTTIEVPETTIPITVPVLTIPPVTVPDTVPIPTPPTLSPVGSE